MSAETEMKQQINSSLMTSFAAKIKSILLTVRSFLFAFYYPKLAERFYNSKVTAFKREVFADISSVIPSDNVDGRIRILEVGVGPGFNLEFYPKECRLIALDKNPHFKKVLISNLKKHPGIVLEKFVNERAENMVTIPSNSIDVVLSSSIHCSVDNSQSVLKEIKRVLVPGGRYFFFEHVLDQPDTKRYKWQIFVNRIHLWHFTWHGCVFADFEREITKFGQFEYEAKRYTIEKWSLTYLLASHCAGCAVKEK